MLQAGVYRAIIDSAAIRGMTAGELCELASRVAGVSVRSILYGLDADQGAKLLEALQALPVKGAADAHS